MMAILVGVLVKMGTVGMQHCLREMEGGLQLGAVGPNGGDRHHGLQELGEHRGLHDPGGGQIQERAVHQQDETHHNRGLVDFGIVVEESFWHEEYVTGSAIMIEKILVRFSHEVSHSDRKLVMQLRSQTCRQEVRDAVEKLAMQSVMQKSARRKQHKFREGNIVKILNTHQVEMEWVDMVTTKLVEWADKVVYNTVRKAVNMVDMMQMTESFIHQYEGYIRKVDCLRKEVFMVNLENLVAIVEVVGTVFNEMKHNMEKFAVKEGDINMSRKVVRTAIMVVVRTAIVEVVRTAITNGEYNTVEIEKKLTVQKGDTIINLFEDIHMETGIIVKSVKVIEKVKKRDINMFEDIHMMNGDIVKFVVMVKEVFCNKYEGIHMRKVVIFEFEEVVRMIIDKKEYNTMEMREELVIEENNILLEDTNMMDTVIFKFEKTVIKMDYRTAEMKKSFTVKKEERHKEA
jgi:hypothetical protein